MQLFHDANNSASFISEVGTGDLVIVTNGTNLFLQKDATVGHAEDFIQCIANGAVKIFHDSQPKLTTLATGIEITGNVDLDGITVQVLLLLELHQVIHKSTLLNVLKKDFMVKIL